MTDLPDRSERADDAGDDEIVRSRRDFLATCGRFAAVTPPAVVALLSTSLDSGAIAKSGGGSAGNGGGGDHGHGWGRPRNGVISWLRDLLSAIHKA